MKILIVYQYYQGRDAPGHSLIYELSRYLQQAGHTVTVVSGESGYMSPTQPPLPWWRRIVRRERLDGVDVIRTLTYSELHKSYLGRLASFISFTLSCPIGMLKADKPDVVLASSPPIFPMVSAMLVSRLRGAKLVLEVRDLWPASAIEMGLLKNKLLIRIMSWVERLLYNQAERIITLTDGIRMDIVRRGWPADKVATVTCGVDPTQLYPESVRGQDMRRRLGWNGRKVALYFGAFGEANNLSVIVNAAEQLRESPEYLFVLIGNGMKKREIERSIRQRKLTNVQILPAVSKDDANDYINAADVCIATLQDIPLFSGAIPTKLIDYMACGKPVVCGIRGEAAKIVEAAEAGRVFAPNDHQQLAQHVRDVTADAAAAAQLGANGMNYVRTHFSALEMRKVAESVLEQAALAGTAQSA